MYFRHYCNILLYAFHAGDFLFMKIKNGRCPTLEIAANKEITKQSN